MGEIRNTIIHLLGAPGTGKYTIAQEMVKLADIRLVDNHLINNPLFSIIAQDGRTPLPARIWDNVEKIWDAVADTMVHISPPDFSFVLTNALFEGDEGDLRHMKRIAAVAQQRKGAYVPVRLLITDEAEHVRRITNPGRRARMKETDEDRPRHYAGQTILKTGLEAEITVDVSRLQPAEAARDILARVGGG